jgi:F0F1-type ATP synthase assembly protein I
VVVLFAGVGAGLGALLDAVALLLIAGVFLGFIAGLALVYSRYRTL